MARRLRHPLVALAAVVALRGVGLVATLPTTAVILASGVAVVGAAFVLTWGAETAEADVPRSFALAVLAIIAVAPEYAVDALYAWEAGAAPGTPASETAANLAVANMTGANRILVGLGWSLIALYAVYRATTGSDDAVARRDGFLADAVRLEPRISVEIVFLGAATVYALFIPLGGGIDALDALVLVSLYAAYVVISGGHRPRAPVGGSGLPPGARSPPSGRRGPRDVPLLRVRHPGRRQAVREGVGGARAGAGALVVLHDPVGRPPRQREPRVHRLRVPGSQVPDDRGVQRSSPRSSTSGRCSSGRSSSSTASRSAPTAPSSRKQAGEIWLTAAQSFFAVTLLVDFEVSVREALALLGLFALQFLPYFQRFEGLLLFSGVYLLLGAAILVARRNRLPAVVDRARRHGGRQAAD